MKKYETFQEFYPFYLTQHTNQWCRIFHVMGTGLAIAWIIYTLVSDRYEWLPLALVFGYGCSWIGHFGFERNKPAAFKRPLYSLMGDLRMFYEAITLQRKIIG